jgi:hypothetical protein
MIQFQYLTSQLTTLLMDQPANLEEDAKIDKKGHIECRHILRSDVDWTNTRKWFSSYPNRLNNLFRYEL